MAIDRAATLRNAEKLLRQGKLDQAIAEYLRVVDDQPRDWNTANVLGDLYVRAGQTDRAVDQFIRIADHLSDEGFLPKASALYKKILKLKPDHEHALLQAAEIAGSQGLTVDARAYLNMLLERRRGRSDQRGVAQILIRLATLDSNDYEARFAAARARIEIKDTQGAIGDFKEIAGELIEKNRPTEAFQALREAAILSPEDEEIRERLLEVYFAAGDYAHARECASTAGQLKAMASRLDGIGQADEALATLREAARRDPEDADLSANLARAFVARGDMGAAAEYLTVETAGNDPQLLLTVAEIKLRAGKLDDGLALVRRLLEEDSNRRQDIAVLGWSIAEQTPEVGYQLVEIAADAAVAQSDFPSAAAALQEYVTRVPNHIPALMRLVEICVDGGLEATMYSAQAQLADAYIAAGSANEARFIAEDLVAREPWDRANIERFRRALVLLGEPDPDGLIAERLSGHSPFMSTDVALADGELPPFQAMPAASDAGSEPAVAPPALWRSAEAGETATSEGGRPRPANVSAAGARPADVERVLPPSHEASADRRSLGVGGSEPPAAQEPRAAPPPPRDTVRRQAPDQFELSSNAIDLQSILGELDTPPTARARSESVEVDLSIVLEDIKKPQGKSGSPAPAAPTVPSDIDGVFAQMRDEASRRAALDAAEEEYKRGLALYNAGRLEESLPALQAASRAPRLRFATASLLGRIHRDRGMLPQAIEWFERAAEAPAPSPEQGHLLLYELGDALESSGEVARALAICMELQSDAGDYRDVASRIDRLAKVQARG